MEILFNCNGNMKQLEAWRIWNDNTHTSLVYGGSKGGGKSFLMISLIFSSAFIYPCTRYFIARKELNDLRKFTLPDVLTIFAGWGVDSRYYRFNAQDNYFLLHNGSRVYFIECKRQPQDPEYSRFGSLQFTQGAIEEAGEIEEGAKNNLMATLGRCNNGLYGIPIKLIMTCNPAKNFLYSEYYKPYMEGRLEPHKAFIQALPTDNKMLPAGYLDNLAKSLNNNQKQRLLYGRWEFDDDPNLLVSYEAVCDCFTNTHVEGNKAISADLAMQGRDRCVMWCWNGTKASLFFDSNRCTASEIEGQILKKAESEHIGRSQIVADSDGLGAYLSSYVRGIVEFHNGAKADDVKYANLKSQCAYKLAECINNRTLRIECSEEVQERVKSELMMLIAKDVSDTSKLALISKDEMKKYLGHSPDYLDSLIYGMYYHLKNKQGSRRIGWALQ